MRNRPLALLVTLALALTLAACAKPAAPEPDAPPAVDPPATEPAPDTREPLALDALNVEFVVDGRDADALLALQKGFPAALTDALAKQDVTVAAVNVTFGTSGEATSAALRSGAVQLAFLSAEDYFPYRSGEVVAIERGADDDGARGLLVSGAARPRLTEALRAALPELAATLAPYAAEASEGVYEYDETALAALENLYEQSEETAAK